MGRGSSKAGPAPAGSGGRPRDPSLDESIILATRERLVRDGYSTMTIGDIAADAKVSRPTLYRRWSTKFDLVVDALDYGFRTQGRAHTVDLSRLEARDALAEAVRQVDPAHYSPDAMVLMGNFAGEANRIPELLETLRKRAIEPRIALVEEVLSRLQERRAVRSDVDTHTIATLCLGIYLGAFYRGETKKNIPEDVVAVLWPAIAAQATTTKRRSTTAARRAT